MCKHKCIQPRCELCERDATIAALRAELETAQKKIAHLDPKYKRLRDALDALASPCSERDFGWWTEIARAALAESADGQRTVSGAFHDAKN